MAGSCQHLHYICMYVYMCGLPCRLLLLLCTNGVDEGTYEHAGLGGGGIRNFLCSGWKSLPRSTKIFCTGCRSAMEWIVASLVHRLAEMVREIGGNPIYLTGTDALTYLLGSLCRTRCGDLQEEINHTEVFIQQMKEFLIACIHSPPVLHTHRRWCLIEWKASMHHYIYRYFPQNNGSRNAEYIYRSSQN
jgi:hypothetical protein